VSTAAPYDEIAEWYGEWIRDGALLHDFILPTVRDLVGDIRGQRVCDIACGQGIVARQLAGGGGGAVVSDVDISSRLLELARSYEAENPAGIEYMWGDAQELPEIPDESFDGMVCNMALMNILSLPPTLDTVARILRPRGSFVFSIVHPCFRAPGSKLAEDAAEDTAWEISGYYHEGFWSSDDPRGIRGKIGSHHPTISAYLNVLSQAGMTVERCAEPRRGQVCPVDSHLQGDPIGAGGATQEVVGQMGSEEETSGESMRKYTPHAES
jgi:SAM-dependent methyltransferase